jgi:hypothetical protein
MYKRKGTIGILVAGKDTGMGGTNDIMRNSSAEFALRVICKMHGYKLHSGRKTWACKIPDYIGDVDMVRKFYQHFDTYIQSPNQIPNEDDAIRYWTEKIGGTTTDMGYGLITHVLDAHNIQYDIIHKPYL